MSTRIMCSEKTEKHAELNADCWNEAVPTQFINMCTCEWVLTGGSFSQKTLQPLWLTSVWTGGQRDRAFHDRRPVAGLITGSGSVPGSRLAWQGQSWPKWKDRLVILDWLCSGKPRCLIILWDNRGLHCFSGERTVLWVFKNVLLHLTTCVTGLHFYEKVTEMMWFPLKNTFDL